jgi:PAS domain S-box-containing protein
VLLVSLFVVAAAAAAYYVHVQTERDDLRAAEASARFAADSVARQLDEEIRLIQGTVAQLAASPGATKSFTASGDCSLTFGGLGGQDGSHLDIVRADGAVTCTSSPAERPLDYAATDWARRALARPLLLAPAVDPRSGADVAIVTAPIPARAGFVAAFVDLAAVGPALAGLYGGGAQREFVVTNDEDQTIVARSLDPSRWIGTSIGGTAFGEDRQTERRDLDGRTRLYAQAPIGGAGWTLYVGEDKDAALAAGDRLERRQLTIISIGLLAVLIAASLLYRYLVVPIGQLTESVQSRRSGGRARPSTNSGPAELRRLGDDVSGLVTAVDRELADRQRAEAEGRAVLDVALDAVVMMDERGRITEFNSAAETMFGYLRDDVLGAQMAETLVPERLREEHYRGLARHLETGEGAVLGRRVEMVALRRDGSEFPVELAISRVPGERPAVFTGFIRDLSDMKRAERDLAAYADQLRGLIESAPDGILMVDGQGEIELVNRQAEAMFGYSAEELLGRTVEILVPDALRERHEGHRAEYLAHPRLRPMGAGLDLHGRRKDGSEFPVEIRLAPVSSKGETHVLSLISDVTELRRNEERLRSYAERLATLAEIQHAILTATSVEEIASAAVTRLRTALDVARATVTLLDAERDEYVVFASDSDTGPDEGRRGIRGPARLLGDPEALRRREINVTEDLAEIRDPPPNIAVLLAEGMRSALSIPLVADDELLGTINLFRRTAYSEFPTHLLEAAREIADELALALSQGRLREQLARHAEELEERVVERTVELRAANRELEAFSYSVSHDLRAPLRAIDGFSRILEEEHGDALPEEGRRYLRLVSENAKNLGLLIDGLLDFSRLGRQALSKQPVELSSLVDGVLADLVSEREGRSVEISVERLPTVECDPLLMKQVLANLVSNALKFTRHRESARIEIGSYVEDGAHVVFVRDNGVGFDMRHADKLFGVFQRLHRAEEYEGTGLGLALVSRIVVQHGGRIWAESEPGEGACFSFTLPAEEPI